MDIQQIIEQQPGAILQVSATDLKSFALEVYHTAREEALTYKQKTYTSREVCDILNISIPTLWRKEKAGLFRPIKIAGKKFYPQSEVDRILSGEVTDE